MTSGEHHLGLSHCNQTILNPAPMSNSSNRFEHLVCVDLPSSPSSPHESDTGQSSSPPSSSTPDLGSSSSDPPERMPLDVHVAGSVSDADREQFPLKSPTEGFADSDGGLRGITGRYASAEAGVERSPTCPHTCRRATIRLARTAPAL
jgi:hypothetical protein